MLKTPPSSSVPPHAWSSSNGLDHTRVDGKWGARVPSLLRRGVSSCASAPHRPERGKRVYWRAHTSDDVQVEDEGARCKRPAFRSESPKSNTSAQRERKSRRERRGKSSGKPKIGEQENRIEGGGEEIDQETNRRDARQPSSSCASRHEREEMQARTADKRIAYRACLSLYHERTLSAQSSLPLTLKLVLIAGTPPCPPPQPFPPCVVGGN
ncbi:hypothetical protein K438DRAFT_1871633, partial [Mycena galopus ATCC 62051]